MRFLKSVLCLVCLGLMVTVSAQEEQTAPVEEKAAEVAKTVMSPRMEATGMVGEAEVMLAWGAPSVRDREIFGELVPFGKVWRTGANECSVLETSKNLMVAGEELPAGKYGLFTIPGEDKWTIIFNSNADQFGHYDYDESSDVLRIEVPSKTLDESVETMDMFVKEKEGKSWIGIKWADTKVAFEVSEASSN